MIYLGRQVGCCEELIMVQQSGVEPCFSLIMGFHSLVHRLQMEPRCIRRGMGFHTQTHTHTSHMGSGSFSCVTLVHASRQNPPHTFIVGYIGGYAVIELCSRYIDKKKPTTSPHLLIGSYSMHGPLCELSSQILTRGLPYLCLSQLPNDKIQ